GNRLYSTTSRRSMDIFITGASSIPGFDGVDLERMADLGRSHELMVLTGAQGLGSVAAADDYFDHIKSAHSSGARTALLYSESKHPEFEVCFWRTLRDSKSIDFLALNAPEAFDVLNRIAEDAASKNTLALSAGTIEKIGRALAAARIDSVTWESGREDPQWV